MDTIMRAVHLMEDQQMDDAIKLLEEFLPDADDENKYAIADLYIQWGFLQKADIILEELLQQYPDESELKMMLADVYIDLKDDKSAINLLNDIGQKDPLYIAVLLQLADLYQSEGLYEVAESKLLEAKRFHPTEPIIDFALGELFFSIGEYKRSIIYYEKIFPQTKEVANISIQARLAEAYAASGGYEVALRMFQEIDSDHPDTLFKFGFTAYYADRKDMAIKIWEKVINLDKYYFTVYYELAKAYFEEGLIEQAFETSKKGLEMDEFNKELYYYSGMLAHQLNKDLESEEFVRQAVVLDPDYKDAVLFLIELLKEKDDFDGIIFLIEEIKSFGAADPFYDWELARAYNEIESYHNAVKYYREAYNTNNQDSEFLKEYGYFLTEDGKINEAIPIFNSYLTHEPSDEEIVEYLNRLQSDNDR